MSEIAYSTTVTADDINNLAVDLGATEFSQFQNAEPYAVQQLNNITKDLVSAGILLSLNRCRLTKAGDKVTIDTGIIVFGNGAKKRITEALQVDFVANTYIYALNDVATNTCQIMVSEIEPTEGDFVMLGQVDATGELTNRRTFATYKTAPAAGASPLYHTDSLTITFNQSVQTMMKRASIPMDSEKVSFVAVNGKYNYGGASVFGEDGLSDNIVVYQSSGGTTISVQFVKNEQNMDVYAKTSGTSSTQVIEVFFF